MNNIQNRLLNKINIDIKWTDLDPYNHLNNSKYFDFMTEARAKLFWEYSITQGSVQLILHECSINFKKPFVYPDTISVEQYVSKVEGANFDLKYIFKSLKDEEIIHANSIVKMVCIDPIKNRICRIPNNLREMLEKV